MTPLAEKKRRKKIHSAPWWLFWMNDCDVLGGCPGGPLWHAYKPKSFEKRAILYCRDKKYSGSGKCSRNCNFWKWLILLRDRPCLELTIVSSNFQALLFLQDKWLEIGISLKAINSSKKVLEISGPSLSGMHAVVISARTAVLSWFCILSLFQGFGVSRQGVICFPGVSRACMFGCSGGTMHWGHSSALLEGWIMFGVHTSAWTALLTKTCHPDNPTSWPLTPSTLQEEEKKTTNINRKPG